MKNLLALSILSILLSVFYACNMNQNDESSLDAEKDVSKTAETKEKSTSSSSTKISASKVFHLSTQEFKEKVFNYDISRNWKYEGSKPCIVDFYADWCRPCKVIAPILEELAEEYKDQIIVYKINTEKESELASAFGIKSIPSLLFIPMKGKAEMIQGALPKEKFKEAIELILLKKK